MKCKKYGTEVGKGVKVCPNCGEKLKTAGKKIITVLVVLFVINIGFTIFMSVVDSIEYSKMTPEEKIEYDNKKKIEREERLKKQAETDLKYIYEIDNSHYAYALIKDYVKENLKSPATAKFPSSSEIKIIKNNDTYLIHGYVDSQNSFGAIVRTKYVAEIQQIGKDMDRNNFVIKSCNFLE